MLSDLELTILSLIALKPRTLSELDLAMDQHALLLTLNPSRNSLSFLVDGLIHGELIVRGPEASGEPLLSLTEAGIGVVQTAVSDLIREPVALGERFELALANLDVLKPQQAYFALQQRRAAIERRAQKLAARGDASPYTLAVAHARAIAAAELAWLDQCITDWRTKYPGVTRSEDYAQSRDTAEHTQLHKPTKPEKAIREMQRIDPPAEA
ncbi:MAG: hypothetical protein KME04_20620 [Pleurocapsa minor GSE-CHR-MK-17-07R]|jgi:hypothetical protein|nr:hypothetical protein [Pleurocapsa minor GSE-CHR-MK 17-07R]